MSGRIHARKPLHSRNQLLQSPKRNNIKRKKIKGKPEWDSSITDLTVFKPSPQELKRNHEIHQPKKDHERLLKKMQITNEILEREDSLLKYDSTPSGIAERKRGLIKEVFRYQEKELRNAIEESDKTLANVQDFFGDNVQKYKGHLNITKAPYSAEQVDSFLETFEKESPLFCDTVTTNVVKDTALNSITSEEDYNSPTEEENNHSSRNGFKSNMEVEKYAKLFKDNDSIDTNQISKIEDLDIDAYTRNLLEDRSYSNTNLVEVKQSFSNCSVKQDNSDPKQSAIDSFTNMKEILDVLEKEIKNYEEECGRSNIIEKYKIPQNLSGYTMNLLCVIIRITNHLKESEIQLRNEMLMRKEIIDAFEEQRVLISDLTNDLVAVQEANDTLQQEFILQKKTFQGNYMELKNEVNRLKNLVERRSENVEDTLGVQIPRTRFYMSNEYYK